MKITLKTTSPNYRQKLSTYRIMRDLSIGLVVIMAYSLYYYYYNFSSNEPLIKAGLIYLVSIAVALATEAIWGLIHKTNPLEQIKNGFPIVTAIILALTLPIGTPLYVVGIGSFVSIFLGKLVFGGFGHNIFNPALVGRVLVHLSFADKLLPYVDGMKGATDVTSAATPAAMLASTNWMGGKEFTYQLMDLFTGNHGGALGETCIWLILLVGVILAVRRVFDFRIPVAYLGTVIILSVVYAAMNGLDLLTYPIIHLCIGGVVFGAVFMATDPVTSPSSPLGKILYGIGLGFLTMIIRLKANYPEGVLFSILMMNMLTPLIDSFVLGRTNTKIVKQWGIVAVCLAISMGCVYGAGYSIQNDIKEAEAKAAADKKKKEEAKKKQEEAEANAYNFKVLKEIDGGYIMETTGYTTDKPMKIEVKISGDTIKSVKVLEHPGETEYYGADLVMGIGAGKKKDFYDKVLGAELKISDVDGVDTATGATMTAKGVMNAIKGAIVMSQIERKVSGNTYVYTMSENGYKSDKPMKIRITADKEKSMITKIEFLEAEGETEYYGSDLIKGIGSGKMKDFYDKYLAKEFAFADIDGVDTSTG
ncbi:MAG: RnfABCDGE type electron transport complex subunit D, partial [Coprobacillus sp.]